MQKKTLQVTLPFDQLDLMSQPAAYFDQGQGPTIVLLHGSKGDSTAWLPLMQQLQSQFRCVAIDLLGFGNSAKPEIRYDIAKEVAFVRAVVEALKIDSFILIGHSFGGWVAAAYAIAYPNAVSHLVLSAAAGIRDDQFLERSQYLLPITWDTPIIDWGIQLISPLATAFGQQATISEIMWLRQQLRTEPAIRSLILDRLRPEDAVDTVEQHIHQISIPTLVLAGENDTTIPRWHSETYAREIPNAHLLVIKGANHALPTLYTQEVAQAVLDFLSASSVTLDSGSVA